MKRLWRAFKISIDGFLSALRSERALQEELVALLVAIPMALYFAANAIELILLIGAVVLVIVVELLNTAVEAVVDRISSDRHPLAKKAKDVGSAAVFVMVLNGLFVWAVILLS